MPEYRPDICAYCGAETWCEYRSNGNRPQCRGCKVERFFENVLYAPIGFKLLGWQRKVLRDIFGTVEKTTGLRQYWEAYIAVAKKNGKSFLIGGLPIYHLLMEDEVRPEAYGAASAKDQAAIVFRAATMLIEKNPLLKQRLKIIESTKRILRRDGNGFYAVISADGDVQDGIEPSLAIKDELHRWTKAKAETLYDVLAKGKISRKQPLDLEITTAGAEEESLLWLERHEYARQVLDGSLQSDRFYAAVWSADPQRIEKEPEYWTSREARVAANPSHEDLGGFLKDEAIVEELNKALASPAKRNSYLRYHLNVLVSAVQERAIEMPKWYACGGDVDLREWPAYDPELLVSKWKLADRPCFAGVDASWTIDLSAVSLAFPPTDDDPIWTLLLFFFMPSERLIERRRRDKFDYVKWEQRGFITATPGNTVDYSAIKDRLRWAREMFDLQEVAYDEWNFKATAGDLVEAGFRCVPVTQNFSKLSEPTKKLLGLYLDGQLRHGNNPVLNWNASCLALQADHKDNVQPDKPERMKSTKRIDGMSATVTALARAPLAQEAKPGFMFA